MSRTLSFLVFGAIGWIVGSSTGVAAFGGAINGAFIFGPIGALIGVLVAELRGRRTPDKKITRSGETRDVPDGNSTSREFEHGFGRLLGAVVSLFSALLAVLQMIWNLEMTVVEKLGLLPMFLRRPWLMLILMIVLTATVPPVGTLLFVTGVAAVLAGASSATKFRVLRRA